MSIIFQTLQKLNAVSDSGQASQDQENGLSGASRRRFFLRYLLPIGGALVVLLVLGFGAVAIIQSLGTRLRPAEAAAASSQQTQPVFRPAPCAPVSPRIAREANSGAQFLPPASDSVQSERFAPQSVKVQTAEVSEAESKGQGAALPVVPAISGMDNQATHVAVANAESPLLTERDLPEPVENQLLPESAPPHPVTVVPQTTETISRQDSEKSNQISRVVQQIETALGQKQADAKRMETLLAQLDRLKGPESPYAAKLRAYWLMQQGHYAQAAVILEHVTANDAGDLEAGINLALIEIRGAKYQDARARLKQLSERHPDDLRIAGLLRKLQ